MFKFVNTIVKKKKSATLEMLLYECWMQFNVFNEIILT